jgi:hypothetical protein
MALVFGIAHAVGAKRELPVTEEVSCDNWQQRGLLRVQFEKSEEKENAHSLTINLQRLSPAFLELVWM